MYSCRSAWGRLLALIQGFCKNGPKESLERRIFINTGSPEECLNQYEHSQAASALHTVLLIACWNAATPESASVQSYFKRWLQTCE